MKIVFSTKNVNRPSFIDTCRFAYDYGFSGFEIYDAIKERSIHSDSILRRDHTADSKRKLINRNLSVSALSYPISLDSSESDPETVAKYVDMAANAGVENVIVGIEANKPDVIEIFDKFDDMQVVVLKKQYPMGSEKHLIYVTTGRKVPVGKMPFDIDCCVQNIKTLIACLALDKEQL